MSDPAVKIEAISKSFGTHRVLDDFSLTLSRGEFVTIVGRSGVGKTTLLRILAGLDRPDDGSICLAGHDQLLGMVGYMPQRDSLLGWKRVLDNVALGLELKGHAKADAQQQAKQGLEKFGLEKFAHYWPWQLSTGMQQRVALLRTFLAGNEVVLLDEPFAALDAITRSEAGQWLASSFAHAGKTVLMVTHDIDEALLLSDRVLVLAGSPATIAEDLRPSVHSETATNKQALLAALALEIAR